MNAYSEIIHFPHHQSVTRQRMSMYDRAAQFAPFAALTGHEEMISETARLTDDKAELGIDDIEELNRSLMYIADNIEDSPEIAVTFFKADKRKTGGEYISAVGKVKRLDEFERSLQLHTGLIIPIADIESLEIVKKLNRRVTTGRSG